jgi:hypothetical protein
MLKALNQDTPQSQRSLDHHPPMSPNDALFLVSFMPLPHVFYLASHPRKAQNISLGPIPMGTWYLNLIGPRSFGGPSWAGTTTHP